MEFGAVPPILRRPPAKRKERALAYFFIASPDVGGHHDGTPPWVLRGWCQVSHIAGFQAEDLGDFERSVLDMMDLSPKVGIDKYEVPVSMHIEVAGVFCEPVVVVLPGRNHIARLPDDALASAQHKIFAPHGTTLHKHLGSVAQTWAVWKCKSIPRPVQARLLQGGGGVFVWPIFPQDISHLGFGVPITPMAFESAPQSVGEDEGAQGQGEDLDGKESDTEHNSSDESDGKQRDPAEATTGSSRPTVDFRRSVRHEPKDVLVFLELSSYLRPSANMRRVLELAGLALGLTRSAAARVDVPSRWTLRRALIRLDMAMMHWERHSWRKGFQMSASWQADSSAQNHYDFFCQRVDCLTIPPTSSLRRG